jgi:DNA-binding response OmpR family regulator
VKVLIAEDDPISRKLLEVNLMRAGYDVVSTTDGGQAWSVLNSPEAPRLAILDWMMPILDGVEICRRIRMHCRGETSYVYVILLTAKSREQDRSEGFQAGVDDYLTKPFDARDLRARLAVGKRIIELQCALEAKIGELREAASHIKQLQGLIPICMHCKRIRDDRQTWHQLENYIEKHSAAEFTHSVCAECLGRHYPSLAGREPANI